MESHNNSVHQFVVEHAGILVGKAKHVDLSETTAAGVTVYDEYWKFCMIAGVQRHGRLKFYTLMEQLASKFHFEKIGAGLESSFRYLTVPSRRAA